jgi:hypothetical protein
MVNRSTSNKQGEVPKPSLTPAPAPAPATNTVKRNDGPVTPLDTTPTSEPLAEQLPDDDADKAQ